MRSIVRANCMSWIFYIRDLRPGQFRDLPMLSQWAKFQLPLFRIGTFPFTGNGVGLGPQWWTQPTVFIGDPPKVIWGHLRSPTVFLRKTFDPKEIETWEWSHCVSSRRIDTYAIWPTWSPRDLDLRSNFDLDLSRSCYTCFDASWRGKTMVSKSLFYHFKHGSYRKTVSLKNAVFLPFVTSDA